MKHPLQKEHTEVSSTQVQGQEGSTPPQTIALPPQINIFEVNKRHILYEKKSKKTLKVIDVICTPEIVN